MPGVTTPFRREDEVEESLLPPPTWPPMAPPEDDRFGTATISPGTPVVAGSSGTWTLTYTAGRFGVDDGGAIRIALHTISDWGSPQLADPQAPDYWRVSWTLPAPGRIVASFDGDLGVRPWKRVVTLRVRDQAMRPGDQVTVTIGDRQAGSPGAQAQTFAGRMRFQVLLDAYGTGIFVPVGAPALEIVAGSADHLRVHAPSDAIIGEPMVVTASILDRWGNVLQNWRETRQLAEPGVQTVWVEERESGLRGESNPVRVRSPHPSPRPLGEGTGYRVFWGDLHAQTEETIGSGTLDEYFSFARDCAAVDFVGHQGNDFQITAPVWRQIMAKTQRYDAANEFITFAGYEWSGNTPGGGDHNVHFRGGAGQRYDLHRSGHWQVADQSDAAADRFPVSELYATFRGREDVILIPHVGGRYANLREYFDESLMPLVEIASCWGVFEWFVDDAFRRGATFGFSAGSDDHTARPGMSHAPRGHFAIGGGLTAVLARERSREALWEAIRARRTYATTGARMLLDVTLRVAGRTYQMGEVCRADGVQGSTFNVQSDEGGRSGVGSRTGMGDGGWVEIEAEVHGTAPLWRVEVVRWPEVVYSYPFAPPAAEPGRHRLRIGWTGARIRARNRLTRWDGTLTVADGRIAGATCWGFDQPENGIVAQDERQVRWVSETAGDWDGIVMELDGPEEMALTFASGPATFTCTPRDVAAGPMIVDAGGVGQQVRVERDPGPEQPRAVRCRFGEVAPAGRSPYVVRVTQQDGQIAWSSPIFVVRE